MLSQEKNVNSSSDEDDDNLPSLSERIEASLRLQSQNVSSQKEISSTKTAESRILKNERKNNLPPLNIKLDFSLSSESEDEESQFLSSSQRIQSTPQIKHVENGYVISESDSDDEIFSNLEEKLNMMTPRTENKENCYVISESDSDDEMFSILAERLNIMTPMTENKENCYVINESDSDDEVFSNLEEKLKTPRTENKENYDTAAGSDVVKRMNEFRTPFPLEKKVSYKVLDSESDESFSNFVEILRTPMSVKKNSQNIVDSESDESFSNFVEILRTPMSVKKISQKGVDSESDESFSNYVERLRTPLSVNTKIQNKLLESDSDDSFLNSARKQAFQTPKSQKKRQENADSFLKITKTKPGISTSVVQDIPNARKINSSEVENEFKALFPSESIHVGFLQKRQSFTHKLYEFFNKKVFNLQLPEDMHLSYTGALKTTAGLTCCSVHGGIYSCKIKLSSSLIISFDRLKETLLHEMCHAAVWIINKRRHEHHGPLWQIWASRCKLILPFIECPSRCHDYKISYSVWYQCSKCQWKKGKCKRVRKYHGALCKRCKTPITVTYT